MPTPPPPGGSTICPPAVFAPSAPAPHFPPHLQGRVPDPGAASGLDAQPLLQEACRIVHSGRARLFRPTGFRSLAAHPGLPPPSPPGTPPGTARLKGLPVRALQLDRPAPGSHPGTFDAPPASGSIRPAVRAPEVGPTHISHEFRTDFATCSNSLRNWPTQRVHHPPLHGEGGPSLSPVREQAPPASSPPMALVHACP